MKKIKFFMEFIPAEWMGQYYDEDKMLKWIQEKWDKETKEFVSFIPYGIGVPMRAVFKRVSL